MSSNNLIIENDLRLSKKNLNQPLIVKIKDNFTYNNPAYIENQRLGFSNFSTPEKIYLFQETKKNIIFPRGLISILYKIVPNLAIIDRTINSPVNLPSSAIKLRSYQVPAVRAMMEKYQGCLVAPPGAGKTIAAIDLTHKWQQRALILTHTKALLFQWKERVQKFSGIKPGIIDAANYDIREITIAMIQSLNNKILDDHFLSLFGAVWLDECHHCPASSFQKVINQFPAQHRHGLTATPMRADGLSFILHAVLGPIVYEIEREALFQEGEIIKPTVKAIYTNFFMPCCTDYRHMINAIITDAERNLLIIKKIVEEALASHCILVLSERIDHAYRLHQLFSILCPGINSACLTSRTPKSERQKILKDMDVGKIRVLFATRIADEGLDIVKLDRLFLTCPIRSTNKVTQQVGRIMRKASGKRDAIIYDFVDSLVGLAASQFNTRKNNAYSEYIVEKIPYTEVDINADSVFRKAV